MIARDSSGDVITNATVSPATGNLTTAGTNRILLIPISTDNTGGISAVTYNGVGATLVATLARPAPQNDRAIFLYALENPASGSNVLSVTFTAGHLWASYASYVGAIQSGEPHVNNTGNQAEPGTLTVAATVTANAWLVGMTITYTASTGAGTGTSLVANLVDSVDFWDSNTSLSAGSQALSVVFTGGSGHDAMIVAGIAPVPTPKVTGGIHGFFEV